MTKEEIIDKIDELEQKIDNIEISEGEDTRKLYFKYRKEILLLRNELKFIDGPTFVGEEIDLYLNKDKSEYDNYYVYMITLHNSKEEIGELRVSLTDHIFFGNIGYHINSSFRGHNYALKSLNLIRDSLIEMGKTSLTITTYPENIASKKTIENFGGKKQQNSLEWDTYIVDLNSSKIK